MKPDNATQKDDDKTAEASSAAGKPKKPKTDDSTTEDRALALAALRQGRFRGIFGLLAEERERTGRDPLTWDWAVCDEGHKLKNPSMQLVRQLRGVPCLRTLILSGTPIQNNLTELWALFDVVTPGLLGASAPGKKPPIITTSECHISAEG